MSERLPALANGFYLDKRSFSKLKAEDAEQKRRPGKELQARLDRMVQERDEQLRDRLAEERRQLEAGKARVSNSPSPRLMEGRMSIIDALRRIEPLFLRTPRRTLCAPRSHR